MRALVVEDDRYLNEQLQKALKAAGYAVDVAFDGEEGSFLGATETYDVVVLDIGLPEKNGIEVLEEWRKDGLEMPVLILTARDNWSEKVSGFDAGADDYVTKPFHMEEVMARLRALVRRAANNTVDEFVCGDVVLNMKRSIVTVRGETVTLTSHEYRLLAYLMLNRDRVVTRAEITEHMYSQDFDRDSNTIEVFMGRLRKKLKVDNIRTLRGLGYIIDSDTAKPAAQSSHSRES